MPDLDEEYLGAVNLGRMKQYKDELMRINAEMGKQSHGLITVAPMYTSATARDLDKQKRP